MSESSNSYYSGLVSFATIVVAPIVFKVIFQSFSRSQDDEAVLEHIVEEKPLLLPIGRCSNCKCFSGCELNSVYTPEQEAKLALSFLKKDKDVKLAGTQLTTDLQIYILKSNRKEWSSETSKDSLMKQLENSCRREFKKEFQKSVKLFWLEGNQPDDSLSLFFVPAMLFIQNIKQDEVQRVIECFLYENSIARNFPSTKSSYIHGTHIFICCHETRDEICGQSGNLLFDKFVSSLSSNFEQKLKKLSHDNLKTVYLHKTSCLSGHKYPANLVLVRWDEKNSKYYGDSYGYVTPDDVTTILQDHVLGGMIVPHLFKGRIALDPKMTDKFLRIVVNR